MLKNYLKIAVRTLLRHKGYSFINVAGLAMGLTCCLLILLFVQDEVSYDRYHANADRIYRVATVMSGQELVVSPTIAAPAFKREIPLVEEAARLYDVGSFRPVVVRYGDRVFQESEFMYADSTVFDVFTLPLLAGDPRTALTRPNTVVLARSTARKYFAEENPLGKVLLIAEREFEVTGVMADSPDQSHLTFNILGSFASTRWAAQEQWYPANFLTYLTIRKGSDVGDLRARIDAFMAGVRRTEPGSLSDDYGFRLQSLTDIHLYHGGRITYVYLFSAIALFIIILACINYVNLATARAMRRAREVGVRKVLGAQRGQLARQFYLESFTLVGGALVLAFFLMWVFLPTFNAISSKALTLDLVGNPFLPVSMIVLGVVVGLLAGSYPALLLSSFRSAHVLKPSLSPKSTGRTFRYGLVALQFAVSGGLIAATCVVYFQLDYVRSRPLGFDKEQIVVLPIADPQLQANLATVKQAVLQHPDVLSASAVNSIPGYQRGGYSLIAEGLDLPEGEYFPIRGIPADADVVETLNLELIAGRGFPKSEAYTPDSVSYRYLVNEATLRKLGWTPEEAVGRRMGVSGGRMGELVGVVKDYHYASMHEAVEPLALFIEPDSYEYLMVKVTPVNVPATMDFLRSTWARHAPHRPFEYTFLDQQVDALYRADEQAGQIFTAFAVLAVLIACLGLYGLVAFSAEQRTKEIGIRKVLGATVWDVVQLLTRSFLRPVAIGLVLAVPVAYMGMSSWLENFAYRIDIGPAVFLLAGGLVLTIAVVTVSHQAVKAAVADPGKILRYE